MGRMFPLLIALMMLPVAAAQVPSEPGIYNPDASTPTTMYFHINGLQDTPINTQRPSDLYAQTVDRSIPSSSSCVDLPEDTTTFTEQSHHTWYGFSSPSIVEYDVDLGGAPKFHPERGISYDVELDTETTPVVHWFLETRNPGPEDPDTDVAALPIPEVVVRAMVREGDDISVGNEALNTGEPIASGETEKLLLAGDASPASDFLAVHKTEDGFVYEFIVPLDIHKDSIDKDEAYNVRIDAFVDNAACPGPTTHEEGEYLMPGTLYVHTSDAMRPRLEWAIMNPLVIEALHPQFVGDDLVIHTFSNSPWGSYDVMGDIDLDPGRIELDIDGPMIPVSFDQIALKDNTRNHDHHGEPVAAVWIWDYKADNAPEGLYTVTMHITNDQQNADAYAIATFEIGTQGAKVCSKNIGDDELECITPDLPVPDQPTPGLSVVGLLAAIGAVLSLRRR